MEGRGKKSGPTGFSDLTRLFFLGLFAQAWYIYSAKSTIQMKSLYNASEVQELKKRIIELSPGSQRQWGKMDLGQMLAHCCAAMEVATGKKVTPRIFIGRILGPIVKSAYVGEKPLPKSSPTDKSFVITDQRDISIEKERLLKLIDEFEAAGEAGCTKNPHSFFGKLTPQEWAISQYKHLDHHLRQFNS
jgi:Protein of unknown function (DUF1569)